MVFKPPQVVDESLVKYKCYQKSNYNQLTENPLKIWYATSLMVGRP